MHFVYYCLIGIILCTLIVFYFALKEENRRKTIMFDIYVKKNQIYYDIYEHLKNQNKIVDISILLEAQKLKCQDDLYENRYDTLQKLKDIAVSLNMTNYIIGQRNDKIDEFLQ